MVYRYECDYYFNGKACEIDCLKTENRDACSSVATPSLGSTESVTDWMIQLTTQKSTRDKICRNLNNDSNASNSNCSLTTDVTPTLPHHSYETVGTTDDSGISGTSLMYESTTMKVDFSTDNTITSESFTTNRLPSSVVSIDTSTEVTTEKNIKRPQLSTEIPAQETSSAQLMTTVTNHHINEISSLSSLDMTTNAIIDSQQLSTSDSRFTTDITTDSLQSGYTQTVRNTPSRRTNFPKSTPALPDFANKSFKNFTFTHPVSRGTSPKGDSSHASTVTAPTTVRGVNNPDPGGPMDYWPAILGGVLGAIAILAAVGVFLYFRRQKWVYELNNELFVNVYTPSNPDNRSLGL